MRAALGKRADPATTLPSRTDLSADEPSTRCAARAYVLHGSVIVAVAVAVAAAAIQHLLRP
ncbi:hypothetical protein ACWCQK_32050 [Streptomyces sp. NPDC002306]